MTDDKQVECWVSTHASLPRYVKPDERYPADVITHAVARGSDAVDRSVASQMAGQIGSGHGIGAFQYLSDMKRHKDNE